MKKVIVTALLTFAVIVTQVLPAVSSAQTQSVAVNLFSGNDYFYKGPVTLKQISDGGFASSLTPGNRSDEPLFFTKNPTSATASASATYLLFLAK